MTSRADLIKQPNGAHKFVVQVATAHKTYVGQTENGDVHHAYLGLAMILFLNGWAN